MTIKIPFSEIKALVNALEKFPLVNVNMPTDLWFCLADNRQKLMPKYQAIIETENGIIKKYVPEGKLKLEEEDPNWIKCMLETEELNKMTAEFDLDLYSRKKLKDDEVKSIGGVPGIWAILDYIITDKPKKYIAPTNGETVAVEEQKNN